MSSNLGEPALGHNDKYNEYTPIKQAMHKSKIREKDKIWSWYQARRSSKLIRRPIWETEMNNNTGNYEPRRLIVQLGCGTITSERWSAIINAEHKQSCIYFRSLHYYKWAPRRNRRSYDIIVKDLCRVTLVWICVRRPDHLDVAVTCAPVASERLE